MDSGSWIVFIMIIICIGIAPVFAGEYQSKSDSLLLTTRYGKSKLIRSKILASIFYTSIVYWSITIGYSIIYFLVLGANGSSLPIQLYNTSFPISYNLTMNQAVVLFLLVGYMATLCIMGVTLFLSSILKSSYSVIIVDFLFIIIPAFLYPSMGGYLWQHVLALMPSKIMEFKYDDYITYSFGNLMLNRPQMLCGFYILLLVILVTIAECNFKKHEVNG